MQINDIFHNCPEQQEQQSDPKDLGSKFPRSTRSTQKYFICPTVIFGKFSTKF